MTSNLSELGLSALHSLNTDDQIQLLDVVDTLRAQGLSDFAALPQLIVCGDQSSGKSSVLAALSDLPFPRKDNLCTRFATEVILRRSEKSSISVKIAPGQDRPPAIKERLEQFQHAIKSRDDFPRLFEKAKDAMGFASALNAISSDVLRIEITGPSHPQLTIVDLPGLIHSENATQTAQDVELVSKLVRQYMSNSRSIILAVISGKNDFPNQAVSSRAREFDPDGRRTLGIITKPDTLPPGSQSEAAFISLARNEQVHLELGWHVVKNLDSDSEGASTGSRDKEESHYFKESNFKTLPSWMVGIANLRQRLSKVLFKQIQIELPGLIKDINSEMHSCQAELTKLGSVRQTVEEQRLFLVDLSQRFRNVCLNAIRGSYDQDFFDEGLSTSAQEKRLRAVVRNLEMDFKNSIYENGPKWTIVQDDEPDLRVLDLTEKTRKDAVDHVLKVLKSSRGCELPGLPSSRLVGIIFREYSAPWAQMARRHVSEVWDAVRRFLERTLQYLTTPEVCDSLLRLWFDPLLTEALNSANRKLEELLLVHKREPMTTNHYFYDTALHFKQQRMSTSFEASLRNQITKFGSIKANDVPAILAATKEPREVDMDRAAAEDALDDMRAYYKTALKLFIDNVPTLVIEVALIEPILDMFCPTHVILMKPETVASIAAENEEKKSIRDALTRKLTVLNAGAITCHVYAARQSALLDEQDDSESIDTVSQNTSETTSNASPEQIKADDTDNEMIPEAQAEDLDEVFVTTTKKDKKKAKSRNLVDWSAN